MKRTDSQLIYSDLYQDGEFEFGHVKLPESVAKRLPKPPRLLHAYEWRRLGVELDDSWEHYAIHRPEPHILLFRRRLRLLTLSQLLQEAHAVHNKAMPARMLR